MYQYKINNHIDDRKGDFRKFFTNGIMKMQVCIIGYRIKGCGFWVDFSNKLEFEEIKINFDLNVDYPENF